jgi:hypothetical protein
MVVRSAYLDVVEASIDSVVCCLGVQLDVFSELRGARKDEFAVSRRSKRDGARSDKIVAAFLLEYNRVDGASKSPKLEENVGPIGMNGVRDLRAKCECTE